MERCGRGGARGRVIAVDEIEIEPLAGIDAMVLDLRDEAALATLKDQAGTGVDVVLSDMAASSTGHRGTDQIRNQALAEAAYEAGRLLLRAGGALVIKAFHGGGAAELMRVLKRDFAEVRTFKPPASRPESAETYIVAKRFRGAAPEAEGGGEDEAG